ncbi:MAG: serine/threonine protein kinase [Planctomycetaceae bacterium]|nr:serine/threonine protein kinase [Planctomycetaceae bacterium]
MSFETPPTTDSDLTTRRPGQAVGPQTGETTDANFSQPSANTGSNHTGSNHTGSNHTGAGADDSEITVISKKPPQQFCTSGFDWRKVGELLVGKQLGTFRLDSLLGVGGMGAVFRATDLQLHREVAVKVLNSSENDPEAERRFRVEAQSAARLDHQHIARVFHVGQDQGWNYIVLELVEGQTLRQLVANRGPLSLKLAIHFFRQLASALDHAHQRNIIHRDIKPSNVLITNDHVIKIVDMGLARIQRSADSVDHDAEEGMTLGTFDYLAPEQARDARQADQQSDLYSLGCTLFYALVGRPPFADGTTIEKILSHSNSPRPSVLEARPDLPPSVDRLVQNLMAARREDRIGTAKELEQRLLDLRWELNRNARPTPNRPANDHAARRVPLMLAAMMLALFMVALAWDGGWKTAEISLPEWPTATSLTTTSEMETEDANINLVPLPGDLTVPSNKQGLEVRPTPDSSENSRSTKSMGDERNLDTEPEGRRLPQTKETESDLIESYDLSNADRVRSALVTPAEMVVPRLSEPRENPFRSLTSDLVFPFLGSENGLNSPRRDWWLLPGSNNRGPTPLEFGTERRMEDARPATLPQLPAETSERARDLITTISVTPALSSDPLRNSPASRNKVAENVVQVESLQLAFENLKQFPNARRIELNFSGVHRVSAPSWELGGIREIRAAANQQPVLMFNDIERASASRTDFRLRVDGGNLDITGVAFLWETWANRGGSLFEILDSARVTFSECTFQQVTSRPPNRSTDVSAKLPTEPEMVAGALLEEQAVQFDWIRLAPMPLTTTNSKPGVLSFSRCAMHGAANGVSASSGRGMLVRWTDCLFITAGSALHFDSRSFTLESSKLEIEATRSSILACRGIVSILEGLSRPATAVSVTAQDSTLVSGDPAVGLFHQQSVTDEVSAASSSFEVGTANQDPRDFSTASSLSFDGFSNTLVASSIWTLGDHRGRVVASADASQIRTAKWFQQELGNAVTLTPTLAVDCFNLTREPAAKITEARWRSALGQNNGEHGVAFATLPAFPPFLNSATQ